VFEIDLLLSDGIWDIFFKTSSIVFMFISKFNMPFIKCVLASAQDALSKNFLVQ